MNFSAALFALHQGMDVARAIPSKDQSRKFDILKRGRGESS
jgi:hypothetical protein